MIIERITGHSWEHEIHNRIIDPLRLRHTMTGVSAYVPQPRATAYLQFPGRAELTDASILAEGSSGDAGMISTPHDVATFFRALLGGELLRPAELAQMRSTVPANPQQAVQDKRGRYLRQRGALPLLTRTRRLLGRTSR